MEESRIFGSNIVLPSLPGLQSDCEDEILLLMKEVDREFEIRHSELLKELIKARSLCHAQRDEIENLRCLLPKNNETSQKENSKDLLKEYCFEVEKLKKENDELRIKNSSLHQRSLRQPDYELQIDSLKRSLGIQQDENKNLRERLSKIDHQYHALESNYQKVVNTLASFSQNKENQNTNNVDDLSPPSLMQTEVTEIKEKFLSEETELCNHFLSKINQEIDDLEKKLQEEVL